MSPALPLSLWMAAKKGRHVIARLSSALTSHEDSGGCRAQVSAPQRPQGATSVAVSGVL